MILVTIITKLIMEINLLSDQISCYQQSWRKRDRKRERETETKIDRERETERERQRDRQRQREIERQQAKWRRNRLNVSIIRLFHCKYCPYLIIQETLHANIIIAYGYSLMSKSISVDVFTHKSHTTFVYVFHTRAPPYSQ